MALRINPVSGKPYSDRYYELKQKSDTMPMNQPENIDNLNRLLDTYQVIVLSSATGSGKTTTINQHMLNYLRLVHGPKVRSIITQPRRAPATEIADWVAQLMDVTLGEEVGYKIKNNVMAQENSVVTFVTEGILLRMIMNDPEVPDFNAIILDECHELTTDLILVLLFLKRLVTSRRRPDLKIVLMSATANISMFMDYFGRCGKLDVPGKMFEVQRIFAHKSPPPDRIVEEGVKRIVHILNDPKSVPGDILFFLSGKKDLKDGCQMLQNQAKKIAKRFKCIEFSSETPRHKQEEIMKKSASHWDVDVKVVMATNVAEASLTIDGIVYVIDSGRANISGFDLAIRQKTLENRWVSKAQIGQRVGRAGRTAPGIAYLLYSEEDFNQFIPFKVADILSEDLTGLSLQLLCTSIFNTMESLLIGYSELIAIPSRAAINASLQNLAFLGALDSNNTASPLGRGMNDLPITLEMARSLIFSKAFHCYYEMIRIAAMSSVDNNQTQPKNFFFEDDKGRTHLDKFQEAGGELMTLLQIYVAFEEVPVEEREAFCKKFRLHMRFLEDAEIMVDKLRKKMRAIDVPLLRQGNQVIVNIPFYETAWLTSRVDPDDIRYNIVRALLIGHFMNVVIKQGNKLTTLKTNVFVRTRPEQKKSALSMYAAAIRMNNNLSINGLTEIQGASWLLEAASHYLATVEVPEQRAIIKELRLIYDVTSIKYTPAATAMSTSPMNSGLSPVDPENTS